MENKIQGLHHITAIAGDAQRNYDFYTKILGLRLVKKTVNFDDPNTYHFYYGNENGSPGTILTFFPWAHIKRGTDGAGMATEIGYSVPEGSLELWLARLDENKVQHGEISERLGESFLPFQDPDGLHLKLIAVQDDTRSAWETNEVRLTMATKGFHSITLTLRDSKPTADILTTVFGYRLLKQEGNYYRFITDRIENANIVDILELPNEKPGIVAGGTNHHVAFRVKDEDTLMHFREKIISKGLSITEKIDRNYFFSLYFREPGGVLFELATENPGFEVDEDITELGMHLKLPPQYEPRRLQIEQALPSLKQ